MNELRTLAADIGGTRTKIAICNQLGELDSYQEFDTESYKGGPYIVEKLIERLSAYSEQSYDNIGISTAGQVDPLKGEVIFANENIPDYTGMKLKEKIGQFISKDIKIENDVNCAALGEKHFGVGKHYKDFLCLTYGTGIGGAIIINGKLYRGAFGSGAEIGHMINRPYNTTGDKNDVPYYEKLASTTALLKEAQKIDPSCTTGKHFFSKLQSGNEQYNVILHNWLDEVIIGLASLIHIFNPEAIILGGGVMEQRQLIDIIKKKINQLIMPSFTNVKIVSASLGNKAGLMGAASLFIEDTK